MKIWTTCTYTPTTSNSLSVRQLKGSAKTLKGLYGKNLKNTNTKILCVRKPRKKQEKGEIHNSQLKDSKRWSENGEKSGANHNAIYNRMQLLAYEEFNHEDFKRREYDSYSLVLYRTLIAETTLQRRNLKYTAMFGDKWTNNDNIHEIRRRINDSLCECERLKNRERKFKEKYFQDPNYLIKGIDTL